MPESVTEHTERILETAISLIGKSVSIDDMPDNIRLHFNRWQVAHEMLSEFNHKGRKYVINLYKARFPEINDSQARLDIRSAEIVFARMSKDSRELKRLLAIERIERASHQAMLARDFKSMASLEGVLQRYLDPMKDPIDAPDWEDLRRNVNVTVVFNPVLAGVSPIPESEVQQLWKKVQGKKGINIQDVEYTVVPEAKPLSIDKIEAENE